MHPAVIYSEAEKALSPPCSSLTPRLYGSSTTSLTGLLCQFTVYALKRHLMLRVKRHELLCNVVPGVLTDHEPQLMKSRFLLVLSL